MLLCTLVTGGGKEEFFMFHGQTTSALPCSRLLDLPFTRLLLDVTLPPPLSHLIRSPPRIHIIHSVNSHTFSLHRCRLA